MSVRWSAAQIADFQAQWDEVCVGVDLATGADYTVWAYRIPQPMIRILDRATFSNVREQHQGLYLRTLAPLLERAS